MVRRLLAVVTVSRILSAGQHDIDTRRQPVDDFFESCPGGVSSSSRFTATICYTLATDSFFSPIVPAVGKTFPGAFAQRRLLVHVMQTAVAMRLRLRASP